MRGSDLFFLKIKNKTGKFYIWHQKGVSADQAITFVSLKDGKIHDENDFALVMFEDGQDPVFMWYENDLHHRLDGYATICGNVGMYYINGKPLKQEDSIVADQFSDKDQLKNFLSLLLLKYV